MDPAPETEPRPESVPFGIFIFLVGAYIGIGHTLLTGQKHWTLPLVGVFVACVGLSYVAPALGRGGKWLDKLTVVAVTLVFNYAVFVTSLDWLRSYGGAWGPRLARIAVVAVDVYLVFWVAKSLLGVQGYRLAGFIGSVLVAIGLHAAGVLDRIGLSSRFLAPIASGALEARRGEAKDGELPVHEFAGTWATQLNMLGAGWITRIAVRIEGGKASATLWRGCAAGDCEAGSYEGRIESRSAGNALAVHFAGETDGMHWIASLRPPMRGAGMWLDEQRIRGADRSTWRQHSPQLKRVAP
jgi:hypothetical protein